MSNHGFAYYKLNGRARAAAIELLVRENEISKEYADKSVLSPRESVLRSRDTMNKLEKQSPELIEKLGLQTASVQIEQREGGHPRAYEHFPHISVTIDDGEIADVFMLCPYDYKGEHYTPESGERIPQRDMQITDFGEIVYNREATLSSPHLITNSRGTKLPDDFDPDTHKVTKNSLGNIKVFIAGGTSLSCVNEYLERKADIADAKKSIEAELKTALPTFDTKYILGCTEESKLQATCCFEVNDNGKHEVWVRLNDTNKQIEKDSAHAGSTAVALKDNDTFETTGYSNGSFRIKPVTNSELGKKLDKLFSRLTVEPDLGNYWQLWNPTAPKDVQSQFQSHANDNLKAPTLETIRGVHYLIYNVDPSAERDACNPPGSIPVSTAEFLWLKDDIADEENCIRPADPPETLAHMRPLRQTLKP